MSMQLLQTPSRVAEWAGPRGQTGQQGTAGTGANQRTPALSEVGPSWLSAKSPRSRMAPVVLPGKPEIHIFT